MAIVSLLIAIAVQAQAPAPRGDEGEMKERPNGPRGPDGPGERKKEVVARFDKNGDKRLNAEERKAARQWLATERSQGRGPRRFGPGRGGNEGAQPHLPGGKVSPGDVKSSPDAPLYDAGTMRTFFLQFEEADWEKQLMEFKNTDVEIPAQLTVDGKVYKEVGVHFRGMSSFMMVPEGGKHSLNLSFDFVHDEQKIGGYRTVELLNSHEDPSYLRSILFTHIAREYLPTPKANFARVVINGESWGVYVNAQPFNKDFIKDAFGTTKGARWKVPGSPNGRGSLAYLGDDAAAYKTIYEIKTKDDPKSWASLIQLTKVLNETPPNRLEKELSPLLDIDGALRFLALDNALINNDGYWIRTSDYSLYQDEKGRFHIIPHDTNETFSKPGGPGFGGGRPGGGPLAMLARQMLAQADKDGDGKLTKGELTALADAWFDKMDADKSGKITQEQFNVGLVDLLPPAQRPGSQDDERRPNSGPTPGARGFTPGAGLLSAADANHDSALTRVELKDAFSQWFSSWDVEKKGSLDEEKLRNGLSMTLPRPNAGRPEGGPERPGVGPGGPGPRGPSGGGIQVKGVELDPLIAAKDANKPLISKLLAVPSLQKRYLEYVHDIAGKWLDWNKLGPVAQKYHALIAADVKADTRKLDSTEDFLTSLSQETAPKSSAPGGRRPISLKDFADQRRSFLLRSSGNQ